MRHTHNRSRESNLSIIYRITFVSRIPTYKEISLAGQTFEEGRERLVTVVDFPCARGISVSSSYKAHEMCIVSVHECGGVTLSVTEITQLEILFTPGSERRLKKSSYSAKFKINWCNLITSAPPTLLYSRSKIVSTSIAGSNHLTNARKPP